MKHWCACSALPTTFASTLCLGLSWEAGLAGLPGDAARQVPADELAHAHPVADSGARGVPCAVQCAWRAQRTSPVAVPARTGCAACRLQKRLLPYTPNTDELQVSHAWAPLLWHIRAGNAGCADAPPTHGGRPLGVSKQVRQGVLMRWPCAVQVRSGASNDAATGAPLPNNNNVNNQASTAGTAGNSVYSPVNTFGCVHGAASCAAKSLGPGQHALPARDVTGTQLLSYSMSSLQVHGTRLKNEFADGLTSIARRQAHIAVLLRLRRVRLRRVWLPGVLRLPEVLRLRRVHHAGRDAAARQRQFGREPAAQPTVHRHAQFCRRRGCGRRCGGGAGRAGFGVGGHRSGVPGRRFQQPRQCCAGRRAERRRRRQERWQRRAGRRRRRRRRRQRGDQEQRRQRRADRRRWWRRRRRWLQQGPCGRRRRRRGRRGSGHLSWGRGQRRRRAPRLSAGLPRSEAALVLRRAMQGFAECATPVAPGVPFYFGRRLRQRWQQLPRRLPACCWPLEFSRLPQRRVTSAGGQRQLACHAEDIVAGGVKRRRSFA